ncbi:unnamed protein product [Tetraodon nigroviridis]|uniref:(spotted green pufferfish) hypothetical protein n=1 Tax=Tetraodon nigroviridis TaxID=99883 RepID=Q4TBV1_TETNG|nr:unnamed protein product [Tetraodon nigroviridis]
MASRDGDVTRWTRSGAGRTGSPGARLHFSAFAQELPATKSFYFNMDELKPVSHTAGSSLGHIFDVIRAGRREGAWAGSGSACFTSASWGKLELLRPGGLNLAPLCVSHRSEVLRAGPPRISRDMKVSEPSTRT